jgi:hypothetical protein
VKKIWRRLILAGAIALVGSLALSSFAFAADLQLEGKHGQTNGSVSSTYEKMPGVSFVDVNGDGICDYSSSSQCPGFVDIDGDGHCDYHGASQGRYFVDADRDGICDYYQNCGRGSGFVDTNGDSICDNLGICGQGQHHGNSGNEGGGRQGNHWGGQHYCGQ